MKDERACHVVRIEKPEVRTKLGGKPGGKTIWKTNAYMEENKMDLTYIGCDGVTWIILAQSRDQWWAFVSAVMNFGFIIYGEFIG
jgi:hypothetical protein